MSTEPGAANHRSNPEVQAAYSAAALAPKVRSTVKSKGRAERSGTRMAATSFGLVGILSQRSSAKYHECQTRAPPRAPYPGLARSGAVFRLQRGTPLQTLLGPHLSALVVLGRATHPRRQRQPGLLGRGEDMNVGRQRPGFVHRSDAHEAQRIAGAHIIAPHRDRTFRASRDALPLAAIGRRV